MSKTIKDFTREEVNKAFAAHLSQQKPLDALFEIVNTICDTALAEDTLPTYCIKRIQLLQTHFNFYHELVADELES